MWQYLRKYIQTTKGQQPTKRREQIVTMHYVIIPALEIPNDTLWQVNRVRGRFLLSDNARDSKEFKHIMAGR